jgi:ATP-dependent RNA helicase DeaD
MSTDHTVTRFSQLELPPALHKALADVGYETPSAIQAMTIPALLAGTDLVGQAQTGTGKTAAFALPALARLDIKQKAPQVLVLAPTRELAIQVAEAFQKYATHMQGFHVLPIYGGSDMRTQLRQLQRGVHVIVGTPGRVMDHMRRGSLDLSVLRTLVLDEADEMLRMGFIDDVEWILEQTPAKRQIALFSATMPDAIRRIAKHHLNNPQEVTIKVTAVANKAIRQRVWMLAGANKLDALTRILEVEEFDGVIVFVRTRIATVELAEKLAARGYSTAALNGDIPQQQREKTIDSLKKGRLDILVATDVAARGLDVERISHVINYDIPYDVEAYVHRIGRTGRAGRTGDAILFAASRERRLLRAIEKATGNTLEKMTLPTADEVSDKRAERFKERITATLDTRDLARFRTVLEQYQHEHDVPVIEIAAALAAMAQGKQSLVATDIRETKPRGRQARADQPAKDRGKRNTGHDAAPGSAASPRGSAHDRAVEKPQPSSRARKPAIATDDIGMERFRIEVGRVHGVQPGNIVGAIANEAEIDAQYIGRIDIQEDHSLIDLPEGMPREVFKQLRNVWVSGQKLQISRLDKGKPAGKTNAGKKRRPKPDMQ